MSTSTSQPLPKTRSHLTSLFASFPPHPSQSDQNTSPQSQHLNPLLPSSPALKPLLLTLHVLFPNELLPALDLLDRKLVTRLILSASAGHSINGDPQGNEVITETANAVNDEGCADIKGRGKPRTVYYVQSSQHSHYRRFDERYGRTYDALAASGQSYEVRLKAWNCSCAAFVFAGVNCLQNLMAESLAGHHDGGPCYGGVEDLMRGKGEEVESGEGAFGGLIRGEGEVPVCKHLLACYLAESWSGFGGCVEERVVSKEEMSGWAAGWGG
ncbi:MAG: hypothetical protein LQ337_008541 [Flavoplaca oasis]|nr:MAG: hypothetical protein LQ337_008541 [Flavoplaca oasis]